jgi:hypothetical protein
MKETIADIHKRYVWRPLLPSYSMPHAEVKELTYDDGLKDGWNQCMSHLKAAGKI